jgi:hypothetical protein
VLAIRDLGRRGAIADPLGAYCHATVTDLADKVGIAEHIPHRVLVEHSVYRGEITLFVQPAGNLHIRILPGGITLEHCYHQRGFLGIGYFAKSSFLYQYPTIEMITEENKLMFVDIFS